MSLHQEYDVLMKAVVIGDSGVGKTSLLHRYTDNDWNPTYIATIGVDFKIDTFETKGKVVKLQMWDTAGQERFKTICAAYYRGAHCIMLVYDVTNRESFENVKMWLQEVRAYAREGVTLVVVGNKADLVGRRQVSKEEGEALAESLGTRLVETSAKTADNVHQAFRGVVDEALAERLDMLSKETEERQERLRNLRSIHTKQPTCLERFKSVLGL
eukprot:TRINITY_DN15885_c0_g1_i2.p1 TRINITY_DN15885_c0_g1~~TRINITY_DN15885_c0_g1_i2.p1  ORF type:complete len:232 (+),score=110.85 TRINITY_DN15885_c0_g1_i2:55-696(+)